MAYIRKLPSGKYQATVRLATGKRLTYTHPLRKRTEAWARDRERELDRGEQLLDVRAGRAPLRTLEPRWIATLDVQPSTLDDYKSTWRRHIEPHLGDTPIAGIGPLEIQAWLAALAKAGVGDRSRRGAFMVLSGLLNVAVTDRIRTDNPCRSVRPPRYEPSQPRPLTVDQQAQLLTQLEHPEFVETMLRCGLRWSEAAAIKGDAVDWLRARLHVRRSLVRKVGMREYGKAASSRRVVPVPADLLERWSRLMRGRPRDALLFTASDGGPLDHSNWHREEWTPALKRADLAGHRPHDLRHSYASTLVEAGVDLYRVQQLLGHSTSRMTQRYAHLAPEAFDDVLLVLARPERASDVRHEAAGPAH